MKSFRIIWTIDVEAENAIQAAEKALEIQRDPNSIATHFQVYEAQRSCGVLRLDNPLEIDLAKLSREDWQQEVANGDTKLGYEEWKEHRVESDILNW